MSVGAQVAAEQHPHTIEADSPYEEPVTVEMSKLGSPTKRGKRIGQR